MYFEGARRCAGGNVRPSAANAFGLADHLCGRVLEDDGRGVIGVLQAEGLVQIVRQCEVAAKMRHGDVDGETDHAFGLRLRHPLEANGAIQDGVHLFGIDAMGTEVLPDRPGVRDRGKIRAHDQHDEVGPLDQRQRDPRQRTPDIDDDKVESPLQSGDDLWNGRDSRCSGRAQRHRVVQTRAHTAH